MTHLIPISLGFLLATIGIVAVVNVPDTADIVRMMR